MNKENNICPKHGLELQELQEVNDRFNDYDDNIQAILAKEIAAYEKQRDPIVGDIFSIVSKLLNKDCESVQINFTGIRNGAKIRTKEQVHLHMK